MASTGNRSKGSKGKGRGRAAGAAAAPRSLRANEARAAQQDAPAAPLLAAGSGRDIAGVVLAIVAVASLIAVVSPSSAPVAAALAGFFHLGFGLGGYVVPLVMLAAAALLFIGGEAPVTARTAAGAALIFCAVLAMLSLSVPGTEVSTAAMFDEARLSSSGGYLGAFAASALQGALGKTISYVVLVGAVVLGLVIIGFSVGDLARGIAERAERFAQRRHVDINESPWGDASAAPAARRAVPEAAQAPLFDEGAAQTTYLGNRTTTLLDHEDDPKGEDPLVDVSDQLAAERARTVLIPVKDRYADAAPEDAPAPEPPAPACRRTRRPAAASEPAAPAEPHMEPQDVLPWSEPDTDPEPADGTAAAEEPAPERLVKTAEGERPVPAFLRQAAGEGPRPAAPAAPARAPQAPAAPSSAASDEEEGRRLPPATMLRHNPASASSTSSAKELEQTAEGLQATLQEFGLHARVVGWIAGPTVTTFKVQPGEGERVSRISSLEDDIALSLATDSVRIFAPIPGTSLVGIEIPNRTRQTVAFGDILPYVTGGPLEFALGRDAEGQPMVADLAKMPHLLIAGTTGSGKSVVISSILMSLLMRTFPEDVRLIMVDPKRVEFAPYDGLPHLYVPVVTEPKQAASALQWAVSEMERRLKIFERIGVRKISTFNEKQAAGEFEKYDNPPAKMPYLVIVIDELSDLMMVAGKDVEASIVRIAQLGRAAGIHMIVATQRPSSNVVTGLIKANITNRIGLTVATGIDSRVILDQTGAEKLIGQGDMLFSRVDWGKPKRIQGCFVSDEEIFSVVEFVKEQSPADYHTEILSAVSPAAMGGGAGGGAHEPAEDDPLIWEAARIVVESQLGSTSGLQRRLKVGYARAGRIMDMLEEKGVVGPPDGSKPREVLLDEEGLAALEEVEARMSAEDEFGGF